MEARNDEAAGDDRKLFEYEERPISLIYGQGVCLGSGIGSLKEQYETSITLDKGVSLLVFLFKRVLTTCRALKKSLRSSCPSSSSI